MLTCWAYTICANLEGLYYMYKGIIIDLSEQMLVDCDNMIVVLLDD